MYVRICVFIYVYARARARVCVCVCVCVCARARVCKFMIIVYMFNLHPSCLTAYLFAINLKELLVKSDNILFDILLDVLIFESILIFTITLFYSYLILKYSCVTNIVFCYII